MINFENFKNINQQAEIEKLNEKYILKISKSTYDIGEQLKRHLPKNQNLTLLEVGCNLGFLSNIIFKNFQNIKLTAIDNNKECIDYAKKLFPNLNFIHKDFKELKTEKNLNFDIILLSRVPHTYEDNKYILTEISNRLEKGKQIEIYVVLAESCIKNNKIEYRSNGEILNIFNKLKFDFQIEILENNMYKLKIKN